MGCGNPILIKLNQIGTLTETLNCIEMVNRAMTSRQENEGKAFLANHQTGRVNRQKLMNAGPQDRKARAERQENAWQAFLAKEPVCRGGLQDRRTARLQD